MNEKSHLLLLVRLRSRHKLKASRDLVLGETPEIREMSAIKQDILWSPHLQDRFITFGTDLKLYSFDDTNDGVTNGSVAGSSSGPKAATLMALNSDNQYLKCVCWYPKDTYNDVLAVGLANGRVAITSFNLPKTNCWLSGKEFVPRHARHCNTLAWNSEDANLLASGLDKHRNDHSLLVWDIIKSSFIGDPDRRSLQGTSDSGGLSNKPLAELAYAEIVHSVQWISQSPTTLIAGINHKNLKIFDIRAEGTSVQSTTSTKAVYGVCTDPFFAYRVASYIENQVFLWDTRSFDKPLVTLYDSKPIVKIAWCPTRANLLATLSKDSPSLKLYALQQTTTGSDDMEPTIVERSLHPVGQHVLQSFCWHPKDENRIVATSNFTEFQNHIVSERITLNWSPTSTLVWSDGRQLQYIDSTDEMYKHFDDISIKIKQRAEAGYGLEVQHPWRNGEFVKEDVQLRNLWHWVDIVKGMREEVKSRPTAKGCTGSIGVQHIISGEYPSLGAGAKLKSDFLLRSWVDAPTLSHIQTYKSSDRDNALQLCGWIFDSDGIISDRFLDRLQIDGQDSRAAAIAVFNLKIHKAMEILNKGALKHSQEVEGTPLSLVAMALSGYVGDRNSLWRDTCDKMRSRLKDPYLTAMFAFLTSENNSYEEVLNDKSDLTVQDKVAFACIFLPDIKLVDLLERLTQQLVNAGNLDGMLLTGFGSRGVDLLQRYIDLTGDIQTASHIALQALLCKFELEQRVDQWVKSYRDMLDQWRLWIERARFDVIWRKVDPKFKAPQQVILNCNFCGKTICNVQDRPHGDRQMTRLHGTPNKSKDSQSKDRVLYINKQLNNASNMRKDIQSSEEKTDTKNKSNKTRSMPKFSSCPGCRKPLPRCALCLVHMGTPSGSTNPSVTMEERLEKVKIKQKLTSFDCWFTWCQTCRHGGHANHMAVWFKEHMDCPATGCNCKCMALDSINSKVELDNFIPVKPSS